MNMPLPVDKDHLKEALIAVLICLAGWLCFSIADTISKWLAQSYSVSQIICLGSLPVAFFSAVMIYHKYGLQGFKTRDWKWHLLRSIATALTAIFVINALRTLPLADFYGITFLSPLITALMAFFFLKENTGWHRLMAILCGFIGVLVIAQPQFETYSIGLAFAFGCTLTVSTTVIALRQMKDKTNIFLLSFFPSLLNTLIHTPLTIHSFIMPAMADIWLFACLSLVITGGLVLLSTGLQKTPLYAIVAPFQYTQIIYGITLGFLIFGDIPAQTTLAGIGIIVLSGLYLIWREYKTHGPAKSKAKRKMQLFGRSRG